MHQKLNILLIEDNKSDQRIISKLLDDAGFRYNMLRADTLIEGIEFLISSNIDIILLDLGLPDSSGYKTLQKIIERNNTIPIIVLTGTQNSIVESLAIKAGAQDYLTKDKIKTGILIKIMQNAILRNNNIKRLIEINEDLLSKSRKQSEALTLTNTGYWSMDLVNYTMEWSKEVFDIFNFQNESLVPSLSIYLKYVHTEEKEIVRNWFNQLSNALSRHVIEHRLVIGTTILHVKLTARISYEDKNQPLRIIGTIQHTDSGYQQKYSSNNYLKSEEKILREFLVKLLFNLKTPVNSIQQFKYLIGQSRQDESQRELLDQLQSSIDEITESVYEIGGILEFTKNSKPVNESNTVLNTILVNFENALSFSKEQINISRVVDLYSPIQYHADYFFLLIRLLKQLKENNFITGYRSIHADHVSAEKRYNLHLSLGLQGITGTNELEDTDLKTDQSLLELLNSDVADASQLLRLIKRTTMLQKGKFTFDGGSDKIQISLTFKAAGIKNNNISAENVIKVPEFILIVDDHFLNRLSTKKNLLNHYGQIQIYEAENGDVAVNMANKTRFDVILMDLQMPVMDGFEATGLINQLYKTIIIGMSAGEIPDQNKLIAESGFTDFIIKPFKAEELIQKISRHLTSLLSYSS